MAEGDRAQIGVAQKRPINKEDVESLKSNLWRLSVDDAKRRKQSELSAFGVDRALTLIRSSFAKAVDDATYRIVSNQDDYSVKFPLCDGDKELYLVAGMKRKPNEPDSFVVSFYEKKSRANQAAAPTDPPVESGDGQPSEGPRNIIANTDGQRRAPGNQDNTRWQGPIGEEELQELSKNVQRVHLPESIFNQTFVDLGFGYEEMRAIIRSSLVVAVSQHTWRDATMPGREESVAFPLYDNDAPLDVMAGMRRNRKGGYMVLFKKAVKQPRASLEDFAFLGNEGERARLYAYLASLAQDETWGDETSGNPDERYKTLADYLRYTFAKLYDQKGIMISDDGEIAAFNTGLVTDSYADIYAVFRPMQTGRQKWALRGFCREDRLQASVEGMEIRDKLGANLPRAQYFRKLEDAVYDATKAAPSFRQRHVVRHRLGRFPTAYLAEVLDISLQSAEELRRRASEKGKDDSWDRLEAAKKYAPGLNANDIEARICRDIEDALFEAHRRASKNFTVAVPAYNPNRHEMGFLLPLRLNYSGSNGEVDLVARVELQRNGQYGVPTVLTPEMGRLNSRLVMGPYDPWIAAGRSTTGERERRARVREEVERENATAIAEATPAITSRASIAYECAEHELKNGSTIGVVRYPDRARPDLALGRDGGFRYASHNHATFTCQGMSWFVTNTGSNGTRVLRDGTWIVLGDDPFELEDGDELEFGNAKGYELETPLERATVHISMG